MNKKRIFLGLWFLAVGLAVGVALCVKFDIFSPAQSQNTINTQPPSAPAQAPSFEGYGMEDAVINVANTTGRAVVSISTEHIAKIKGSKGPRNYYFNYPLGGEDSPFGGNEQFRSFFDDFFGDIPDREFKRSGLGSGVIIDAEGYILTNEHVIDDADKITVKLPDGREFKGEIKGKDVRSDLAVIKIDANNLPVAVLGDSNEIKIGQWVVAIGNPFGFALENAEPTVTAGVIGALHRSLGRVLSRDKDYSDLIQTDAAINPGNSGGPLVNLKGQVVGINVAIFSTSGGYQGVGFAIPVNNAKRIISRLIEGKKILYGWLGVTVQDLTEDMAKYFGLASKEGVLVAKVMDNSPAQKAGMKESDVIKQVAGKPVNNVKELISIVSQSEVGSKIKVLLVRDKKELSLDVEVGERPENLEQASQESPVRENGAAAWRGLEVEGLTEENIKRFQIQEKAGVVITDIAADSPGQDAGLNVGDLITEINKNAVNDFAEYQKVTKDIKGDALVKTQRGYFLIKGEEQKN
ncbi:MAG: Do family serine endopeptidase [Candidatus Omnitrophica bacterium]|nr:Do family serine endopeptidase [Candidatus Omnitrophota bacterium]